MQSPEFLTGHLEVVELPTAERVVVVGSASVQAEDFSSFNFFARFGCFCAVELSRAELAGSCMREAWGRVSRALAEAKQQMY